MNAFSSDRFEFIHQGGTRPAKAHYQAGALLEPLSRFVTCGDRQWLREYHGWLRPVTGQEFSRECGGRHAE